MLSVMLGAACSAAQEAPYRWDTGAGIGVSGYLGDAGHSLYRRPGVSAEASMRYTPNVRWAFRGVMGLATLKGSTADWSNVLPQQDAYQFSGTVYSIEVRAEFNFLPYGIGPAYQRLSRWTPYLMAGAGLSAAHCQGTIVAPTLPLGAGIKYKASEKVNLMVEFSMAKVLSDKVDGLDDPIGIKSSFFKNTDWYSRLAFSVSYAWGERCATCHYVD